MPEQGCCGVPMSHYGFEKEATYNAKKTIDSFSQAQVDAIIATCASCIKGLKEYSQLLVKDEDYAQRAKEFSNMSFDVSEFLWSHPEDLGIDYNHKLGLRLAYHDPCHLVAAGVTEQPRQILRNIAEDFVEIAPGCCGGAGAYMILHAEESKQIFDLKAQSIRDGKPDYVVSSCPGCVIQLKDGLRRNELSADSLHIVHLLDRYYQLNGAYR
jgi:glycolate oxidase iron-sulfur subunit